MVSKLSIDEFLSQSSAKLVVDVRSPAEFNHAHIPGALSLPLFSDEERAVIGTLYKQVGRDAAMMKGLGIYGENMQRIIADLKKRSADRQIFIYCWRGGMRSAVVAWMLDLFGYQVSTLTGGYKSFRHAVLEGLSRERMMLILGGKTGSAKTRVLHQLKQAGEQAIDLEALAHHKGSAFGDLGERDPPSQEQFENNLWWEFQRLDPQRPVWIEDESQRIGWVNIPKSLWLQMRQAWVYYLDIPFETRLNYLTEEYGKFPAEGLKAAALRLHRRLGGLETKNAIQFIEEGKISDAFSILLKYYDKHYARATSQRNQNMIIKIPSGTIDPSANAARCLAEAKASVSSSSAS